MSEHSSHGSRSSKVRHYIIMTTVVVVGLFVLLLFNNNSDSFGFTSAVVENVRNSSLIDSFGGHREDNNPNSQWEIEEIVPSTNDIEFLLSTSIIPKIKKITRADDLKIVFNDLSTTIKVNEDKLELNGVNEVVLGIRGFIGEMDFDDSRFSLDGIAKKLEVNGISLSSTNEIQITFKDLNYQKAGIIGAEFKDIEFVSGEGSIKVGNRLDYDLENGQLVTIHSYFGDLNMNKAQEVIDLNSTIEESSARLEGFAKGLDITNGALSLNLR
jgi:hypothetical protein